uniref:Nidogen-1 n=1 Tax=Trichuris muris TaxID=70415 RepID=A0A5S6R3I4_TRIMR
MFKRLVALWCCLGAAWIGAIPKQNFYPYGSTYGDKQLEPWDDQSSNELQLHFPICFYDKCYRSVYVNSNGMLSFNTELPSYTDQELSEFNYPIIAIFYADVDILPEGQNGRILYRTTNNRELLDKSSHIVQSKFHVDASDYEARMLLIATWDSVGRYRARDDKRNSFQLVISTNGSSSYAEFLYADGGLQWIQSDLKYPNVPNPHTAQAGFAAPRNEPYLLSQSNAPTMSLITEASNVDLPGMFLYRITGKITEPKMADEDDYEDDNEEYEEYMTESEEFNVPTNGDQDEDSDNENQEADTSLLTPSGCKDDHIECASECSVRTNANGCPECICDRESKEDNMLPTNPWCPDDPYRGVCPDGCHLVAGDNCQRCDCTRVGGFGRSPEPDDREIYHSGPTDHCRHCSAAATCENFQEGSCCKCRPGYVGDGVECTKEEEAQRLSGRLTGRLNGVDITDSELHTYAVLTDGRTYTAFSRVPQEIGPSMLLLSTLGSIMGWIFGKPMDSYVQNGLSLTGARLNRSITVHIADRHTVTIQQRFLGRDEHQYIKCDTFVSGTLPPVDQQATVDFGEHFEEFVRFERGVIKSYTNLIARVGERQYPVTVDQTIRFQPCPYLPYRHSEKVLLKVERSYSIYDVGEQIVRYAAGNSIEIPGEVPGQNPCSEGIHDCVGSHMICVPEGSRYRCACQDGYQMHMTNEVDRRMFCADVDECSYNLHRCDGNADCHNVEGSYLCQCRSGFEGDGYRCTRMRNVSTCDYIRCGANAYCSVDQTGQARCFCANGYEGDGHTCTPVQEQEEGDRTLGTICRSHEECSKYGHCVYNEAIRHYQCQCRPPYSGDGVHCFLEAETCEHNRNCHSDADCVYEQHEEGGGYRCRCRPGFTGNGYDCRPLERIIEEIQCNVLNTCNQRAECVHNPYTNKHECQCMAGYTGDGYNCQPDNVDTQKQLYPCQSADDCHMNAHCIVDERTEQYVCECLPGFKGDGQSRCEPADECNPGAENNGCGLHASCAYSDATQAYTCQCMHGYTGDGKTCTEDQVKDCSVDRSLCHEYADCTYDHHIPGYTCKCRHGFHGNGYYSCQQQRETVCDQQNVCDPNAQCVPSQDGNSFSCICNADYEGDGYSCRQVTDCVRTPSICDQNAVCVSENMRYACRCKQGYHGSGFTCRPDSRIRGRSLIFSHGMSLVQRGLQPDDYGKQLVVVPYQVAVGLDFDCKEDKIYWSDVSGHCLRSSNLDGSEVHMLFDTNVSSPEGVCIDSLNRNLYYADSVRDEITVVSLNTKHRMPIIKEGLINPRALALDPVDGKLYYSDWNRDSPVIGRLNLDGTGREDYVTSEIALPNGLEVLPRRREICWADAGTQRLECVGTNHLSRHVVYAPVGYPFGLTAHNEETFYWTDWEDKRIHSVSIYGGDHQSMMPAAGGSGKLYGIIAVPSDCWTGESACTHNNGGCKYVCIPDRHSGRRCLCPEDVSEAECNQV